jgi:hypothetical protein
MRQTACRLDFVLLPVMRPSFMKYPLEGHASVGGMPLKCFLTPSRTLPSPNFVQRASRKVVKKSFELCSDKNHSTSPNPKGHLVSGDACSQRLFCDAQESGRFSNVEKYTVDRSPSQTGVRLFDGRFAGHEIRSSRT